MASIRRLASAVIDRIAAGEVIERPASVVKELLENAVDAGASQIEIDIERGGLGRVVVSDDGQGIRASELGLAVERHATSKLSAAEDLFRIRSLGFRGEALSAIASVSRLTLTSRRRDSEAGRRLVLEGGKVTTDEETGCPVGTTVDVRDLFYNTPARRKFMRAPATEQSHVIEACARVMLGAPACGLVLRSGQRRLLDVPAAPGDDLELRGQRVRSVLKPRVERVLPFRSSYRAGAGERDSDDSQETGILVTGFLAPPQIVRRDNKGVWFLVNGRHVRDRTLQRAMLDAYGVILARGTYPVRVVEVSMSPASVDVNVHPQKSEVRFADSRSVYRAVSTALTQALAEAPWDLPSNVREATAVDVAAAYANAAGAAQSHGSEPASQLFEVPQPSDKEWVQPLGDVGAFALCRRGERLYLVDRFAAIAAICYRRLQRELATGTIGNASLLFPETLEPPVQSSAAAWLDREWQSFEQLGFVVEPVGPGRYAVRAVPAALETETGVRQLVLALLDILVTAKDLMSVIDELLARCARHAAAAQSGEPHGSHLLERALDLGDDAVGVDGQPISRILSEADLRGLLRG